MTINKSKCWVDNKLIESLKYLFCYFTSVLVAYRLCSVSSPPILVLEQNNHNRQSDMRNSVLALIIIDQCAIIIYY